MALEIVVGVITVVLFVWWLCSPSLKLRRMGDKIPGPSPYPLVGNAITFHIIGPKAFHDFSIAKEQYGRTFRVWLGPQLHVIMIDPNDIQVLLASQKIITKASPYYILDTWLNTGLLVSTGDLWHKRRKAITPTFHFKVLDDFVPIFNKCAETLVDILKAKADNGKFDITPSVSNCALDTVSQSAMGVELEAQTNPKSTYVESILSMTRCLSERINFPWLGLEPLYTVTGRRSTEKSLLTTLHDLPRKVLERKKVDLGKRSVEQTDENEFGIKKRSAFLELLLDMKNKNSLAIQTDQDIMDEVTTFMFEGHDTTTAALSFTLWSIGKYPEVQKTLYKEVSSILSNIEELQMEDIQQMKYLEAVIKESLRLYPPVPIIGRRVEEDTEFPSGYVLPAGCDVYAGILLLHRDPEYFPDPEKFDPERFLSKEQKHPYAYIPFSAGPRNCIGQKFAMTDLKVIISKVVYNYEIQSEGDLDLNHEMILRVVDGPNITLKKRHHDF